ncbi:MAG: primosomal replication protein PriB/PriC domain protein [Magnetococcales bacterium]|nr:primosomal replication protein PriB/PriC domain protein [Magnetococcales bacterium]
MQEMVDLYINAEKKVLRGKRVVVNGMEMGREDLDKIIKGREKWETRLTEEMNSQSGQDGPAVVSFG